MKLEEALRAMRHICKSIVDMNLDELEKIQDEVWIELNNMGIVITKIWEKAIIGGNVEIIEILYNHTRFVPAKKFHIDILVKLIEADKDDMIKRIITVNGELSKLIRKERNPSSALIVAIQDQKYNIVEMLLNSGASPNMYDGWDNPLGIAIEKNDVRMCKLLLTKKANPRELEGKSYPHIFDVKSKEMVKVLLESGKTSWNERDCMQRTFLHRKIWSEDTILLETALQACSTPGVSVNVDSRDNRKMTPLHYAAGWGNASALRLLIKYGATIDAKDIEGETPLIKAITGNNSEMVRVLLAEGANPQATDKNGMSAFEVAYQYGFEEGNVVQAYLLVDLIKERFGEYIPHLTSKFIDYLKE